MGNNRKKSIIDQIALFKAVNARIKCFLQKIRKIQTKIPCDGDKSELYYVSYSPRSKTCVFDINEPKSYQNGSKVPL